MTFGLMITITNIDELKIAIRNIAHYQKFQSNRSNVSILVPMGIMVPEGVGIDMIYRFDSQMIDSQLGRKKLAYEVSPYECTILVDHTILIPVSINWWWEGLRGNDIALVGEIMTHQDEPHTLGLAESFLYQSMTPVYASVIYFEKTTLAERFFYLADVLDRHWEEYIDNVDHTIDHVVTAAAHELVISPLYDWFSFVHMGAVMYQWGKSENWANAIGAYISSDGTLVLGNYAQSLPVLITDSAFYDLGSMQRLGTG